MASTSGREKDLDRLIEKETEDSSKILDDIETWKKYAREYKDLKNLINNMKDKIRHPYRVPIAGTQMGFIPGHIVHTNELLVLLGDNYFAMRSAKQANEIIDRRLKEIENRLKDAEAAKKRIEQWLEATQQHKRDTEEFVEIIERS